MEDELYDFIYRSVYTAVIALFIFFEVYDYVDPGLITRGNIFSVIIISLSFNALLWLWHKVRMYLIPAVLVVGLILYFTGPLFVIWVLGCLRRVLFGARAGGKVFSKVGRKLIYVILIAVTLVLNVFGAVNSHTVRLTSYAVPKETLGQDSPMRIVLVSDLHIGVNSTPALYEDMVAMINDQNADVVLVAGDIITNSFEAISDPSAYSSVLKKIDSNYGTYVVYGNHDVEERQLGGFTYAGSVNALRPAGLQNFLKECGWKILADETDLLEDDGINDIYIVGRRDRLRPGDGVSERASLESLLGEIDPSANILLLQHEPDDLENMAGLGVDLALSGHTHNGQVFPGNIIMSHLAKQSYGIKQWGNTWSVVTSGVGYFGPPIRVGTCSEVVVIDLQ